MGNFYVNYTVRTADQPRVVKALSGRKAFVTPPSGGALVVYDEAADSQEQATVMALGELLSSSLDAPVLAVLNHDDDLLWYGLFEHGECTDEYDSSPGYFDPEGMPQPPSGGDVEKLCAAFGSLNHDEIAQILKKSAMDDDGYLFAIDRHEDLVKALNLPDYAVGFRYALIAQGDIPPRLEESDLAST